MAVPYSLGVLRTLTHLSLGDKKATRSGKEVRRGRECHDFVLSSHSDYLFKLLLIGDSGVGKSCLLLRFSVSFHIIRRLFYTCGN